MVHLKWFGACGIQGLVLEAYNGLQPRRLIQSMNLARRQGEGIIIQSGGNTGKARLNHGIKPIRLCLSLCKTLGFLLGSRFCFPCINP